MRESSKAGQDREPTAAQDREAEEAPTGQQEGLEALHASTMADLRELNEAITDDLAPHGERLRQILGGLDVRTFGSQDLNAEVTDALADVLRRLGIGVECPRDEAPAVLRNYPHERAPDGNYRFLHSEEKDGERRQVQHGGFDTFADLKLVPRPYQWGTNDAAPGATPETKPQSATDPALEERLLLGRLRALMTAHPDRVTAFLDEVTRVAEEFRPGSTERTLNSREASKRIGVSHVQVIRLLDAGRLGERTADGKPRFSEKECDDYRESDRKRGRPKSPDHSV